MTLPTRRLPRLAIVQVGAGKWGRSWAELVADAPGFALVGVVDASSSARAWAASTLGTPTFRTLGRALAAVPAEAVLIVAPPAVHRPLAEEAMAKGRHVVVEKPLAHNLADAQAIADAADRHERYAVVAQNYRFRRQARALQRLVHENTLGPLRGVRIVFQRDLRRRTDLSARDWRGRMRHPLLLDMTVHHVDLLRAITGREVVEVDARSWPAPDGPFGHHPIASGLLELDGGISVAYDGSWAGPGAETSWNGDWDLLGAEARAMWTGGQANALAGVVRVERDSDPPRRIALPRLSAVDRLGVLQELRRAVAAGDAVEVSARDNLRTLGAVLALARSCDERRPVRVDEVFSE